MKIFHFASIPKKYAGVLVDEAFDIPNASSDSKAIISSMEYVKRPATLQMKNHLGYALWNQRQFIF